MSKKRYRKNFGGKFYTSALISQREVTTVGVWKAMKEYGYKDFINIEY